ncbi:unnamed protein product [Prorocentrum cordatum]|uniref:Bestrophin homolog n=1 Tax=Prorocentrum cordatum TaxID=2364126 RepID=A0ABN9U8P8_9DINO|nr:unnamed protein product [Polarella glacialis]
MTRAGRASVAAVVAAVRGATGRSGARGASRRLGDAADRLVTLRFQLGVGSGLGGVLCASYFYGKRIGATQDDSGPCHPEMAWASDVRGPLAGISTRAFAVGPLCGCCGSAALATLISARFPGRVASVAMNHRLHSVLGWPLAILMAFRFQAAHDRWWSSREHVEKLASGIVGVALLASTCADDPKLRMSRSRKEAEDNETRLLGLLDALCYFVEEQLMCGQAPHESNAPASWAHWSQHLSSVDRDECPRTLCGDVASSSSRHADVCWCLKRIVDCVQAGQTMGAFTPEMASHLHALLQNILDSFRQCGICVSQREPSSYIVHTRTFVYMWCFFFPWTIIGTIPASSLIPTQFAISYALLGIEFCAREMDYPFGDDEGDVPVRQVLAAVREEISRSHGKHYRPQFEAEPAPAAQGG